MIALVALTVSSSAMWKRQSNKRQGKYLICSKTSEVNNIIDLQCNVMLGEWRGWVARAVIGIKRKQQRSNTVSELSIHGVEGWLRGKRRSRVGSIPWRPSPPPPSPPDLLYCVSSSLHFNITTHIHCSVQCKWELYLVCILGGDQWCPCQSCHLPAPDDHRLLREEGPDVTKGAGKLSILDKCQNLPTAQVDCWGSKCDKRSHIVFQHKCSTVSK